MLLEAVMLFLGFYLFGTLGFYAQAVVKSHETLGFWTFKMQNGIVGVCRIPKFFTFWLGKKISG
jgi:hypothetical protein